MDSIDYLGSGREMDVLIALKVFGWKKGFESTGFVECDYSPDDEDWFEDFETFDVFLYSHSGEKIYLWSFNEYDAPKGEMPKESPPLSEWYDLEDVLPKYSLDIGNAWEIVKELRGKLIKSLVSNLAEIYDAAGFYDDYYTEAFKAFLEDDDAPHSICVAALKAVLATGGKG